ncbi:MAG: PAS domain S-box protein, partial [Magnetococcales bacterium]|nr:PAS domain S-box protein [Magnetococcales bacterium]
MEITSPIIKSYFLSIISMFLIVLLSLQWMHHTLEEAYLRKVDSNILSSLKNFQQKEGEGMAALLTVLSDYPGIQESFVNRDRQALLRQASPFFEKIKQGLGITHLYFHRTDRTVFLRVHHPERFDDLIARNTLLEAEGDMKVSLGMELGPLGTFTYRVVAPWREPSGQLIGYIELGMEVNHLFNELKESFNIKAFPFIQKKFLVKELWEQGMQMLLGSPANWDRFEQVVVAGYAYESLPLWLKNDTLHLENSNQSDQKNEFFYWFGEHEHFRKLDLFDVSGRKMGWLGIVIDDEEFELVQRQFFFIVIVGLCLIATLISLRFYKRLSRVEERVDDHVQQLVEKEARYRAILSTAMDAIVSIDDTGRVLEFNKAAEQMFGFSRQEIIGRKITETIIPPDQVEKHKQGMERYL